MKQIFSGTIRIPGNAAREFYNGPTIEIPTGLKQSRQRFFNFSEDREFNIRNEGEVKEIDIYDEIGYWGVDAKSLRRELRGAGDVHIRMHSPGGDVFDGISMYNDLAQHPGTVNITVMGLAASAASLITMSGDNVYMAPGSMLMMHNVWSFFRGDRHDFREMAENMAEIDASLRDVYAHRSSVDPSEIETMMDDETWLSVDAAVDLGFADEAIEAESPKARYDLTGFANLPRDFPFHLAGTGKDKAKTPRDIERILTRYAGHSRSEARALMRAGLPGMRDAAGDDNTMPGAGESSSLQPLIDLAKELNNETI